MAGGPKRVLRRGEVAGAWARRREGLRDEGRGAGAGGVVGCYARGGGGCWEWGVGRKIRRTLEMIYGGTRAHVSAGLQIFWFGY